MCTLSQLRNVWEILSQQSACLTSLALELYLQKPWKRLSMVFRACNLRAGKAEAHEAMGLTVGPAEPDLQAPGH